MIPYTARAGLLDELLAWTDADQPFAAAVIGGRGGTGKTRLGVELCTRLAGDHWVTGLLQPAADAAAVEELAAARLPRLVVVDYAETRLEQLQVVVPLLSDTATQEHPVRLLLLVRAKPASTKTWTKVLQASEELDHYLQGSAEHVLGDLPLNASERRELFEVAAGCLAARQSAATQVPAVPGVIDEPAFKTPVMVVIAAFLATTSPGRAIPGTRDELLDELLRHEQEHWRASASAAGLATDATVLERVVALATLAGAAGEADGAELLKLIEDLSDATNETRMRLARWAHELYPGGEEYWRPLEPDLLGEQLITRHFQDDPAVLTGVLHRRDARAAVRPLEVYARLATDRQQLAPLLGKVVGARLQRLCEQAVGQAAGPRDRLRQLLGETTLAGALAQAVSVLPVETPHLSAAHNTLPGRADLVLGPLGLALSTALTSNLEQTVTTDEAAAHEPALAMSLNNLSNRLGDAGRREEATTAIQRAVEIYERLGKMNAAAYEPDLAMSLNNLSVRFGEAGRREEAITAIQRAVEIRERLGKINAAAYEPDLASSLNNLSVDLALAGRLEEAITAIQRAVEIYERLGKMNAAAYEPDLASSLNNLSVDLAQAGRREEAITAIQRAVEIYERLGKMNAAAYEPALATSLNNLSIQLGDAGRREEAITAIQRAVEIRERLAMTNAAAYEPALATSLHNLSVHLGDAGRREEAITAIQRAVEIRERLAMTNAAAYEPALASSLHNLSVHLGDAGRREEAITAIQRAVEIYERHPNARESRERQAAARGRLAQLGSE